MNVGGLQKIQSLSVMSPPPSTELPAFANEGFASVLGQVTNAMETMLAHQGPCLLSVDQPAKIFSMVVDVCQDVMNEEHTRLTEMRPTRDEMSRSPVADGPNIAGVRRCSMDEASALRLVVRATVHECDDASLVDLPDRARAQVQLSSDIRDRVRKDAYVRQLARCLGVKILSKALAIESDIDASAGPSSEEMNETHL
ncbi:hypothetical protein ACJ51O_36945 (plasmid) [Burkholderia pyrrocinia]|uniref:hypothetical protein n=1 Tax=Burkholderia pyrrocinia TaxID=60550 RepID=UPI0038B67E4D